MGKSTKKKELADFFPKSYKPKVVAFGSSKEVIKPKIDTMRINSVSMPGPGTYLDISQDSSFAQGNFD